jgi:pyruvate kinase
VSPEQRTIDQLSLVWGIHAYRVRAVSRLDDLIDMLRTSLVSKGVIRAGSTVVLVGGHPIATGGATNFVKATLL